MAGRIRTLKPEVLDDEKVAALSDAAFRLFIGAILLADDYGNLRASNRFFLGKIWWARTEVTETNVALAVTEVEASGLLDRYQVRRQFYAHVAGWKKHQRMDNAGKPQVPGPDEAERETPEPPASSSDPAPTPTSAGGGARPAETRGEPPRADHDAHDGRGSRAVQPLDQDLDQDHDLDLERDRARAGEPNGDAPEAEAILAKLREHPPLRDIAEERIALELAAPIVAGACTLDAALEALDELAAQEGPRAAAEGRMAAGLLAKQAAKYIAAAGRRRGSRPIARARGHDVQRGGFDIRKADHPLPAVGDARDW